MAPKCMYTVSRPAAVLTSQPHPYRRRTGSSRPFGSGTRPSHYRIVHPVFSRDRGYHGHRNAVQQFYCTNSSYCGIWTNGITALCRKFFFAWIQKSGVNTEFLQHVEPGMLKYAPKLGRKTGNKTAFSEFNSLQRHQAYINRTHHGHGL